MASKTKLSKKEAAAMVPAVKEFNGLAKQLVRLLGLKVEKKEKKISIMVSRIAKPDRESKQVNVVSVGISEGFLKKQRKKRKDNRPPGDTSGWNNDFSSQRGFII
ncbi:MAG: hypothetical protein O3A01_06240 [bacterium]|nr:hypothetical protein [bacterium]